MADGDTKNLAELIDKAEVIFSNPDVSWEDKYSLIFGMKMWDKFKKAGINITWYDPDTSYEDDITAWMWAIRDHKVAAKYILIG